MRISPSYKEAYSKFINAYQEANEIGLIEAKLPYVCLSILSDCPLIYEEFPMLPKETLNQFEERILNCEELSDAKRKCNKFKSVYCYLHLPLL